MSLLLYHLFLEDIPAYICTKCKEKLFEETEVEAIQKLISYEQGLSRNLKNTILFSIEFLGSLETLLLQ